MLGQRNIVVVNKLQLTGVAIRGLQMSVDPEGRRAAQMNAYGLLASPTTFMSETSSWSWLKTGYWRRSESGAREK
jgi:hypothetical protein